MPQNAPRQVEAKSFVFLRHAIRNLLTPQTHQRVLNLKDESLWKSQSNGEDDMNSSLGLTFPSSMRLYANAELVLHDSPDLYKEEAMVRANINPHRPRRPSFATLYSINAYRYLPNIIAGNDQLSGLFPQKAPD